MAPLSFIIISYNRPGDLLELIQNISALDSATELLREVIIVNNASIENYKEVENFIQKTPDIPFRYFEAAQNLGVAKGRNYAIEQATAPILIMLDDDAILQNRDCLLRIMEEFNKENDQRPKAVLSFKVLYYDNLKMQENALPHKKFKAYKDLPFFETYYYAGGAHAIKRHVIEELGRYPEDFFYGMEEYDLGYRILEAGYSIVYTNKIVMLHKESPLGRNPKKEKLRMMWLNKSKVAYRYLPKKYFFSTAVMWGLQYLRLTSFDFKGFIHGWKDVNKIPINEKRKPVSASTFKYLKKLQARLWY